MDIKKYQYAKTTRTNVKRKRLNLTTSEDSSKWMAKNNVSPQKVWDITIQELMKKKK